MNTTTSRILGGITCMLLLMAAYAPLGAESITVKATLVAASQQEGQSDASLKGYLPGLKRSFNYKTFRKVSGPAVKLDVPGKATVSIGKDSLGLEASSAGAGQVRLGVDWRRGKKQILRTTVVAKKSKPAVFGGPTVDGEKMILLLEYR